MINLPNDIQEYIWKICFRHVIRIIKYESCITYIKSNRNSLIDTKDVTRFE